MKFTDNIISLSFTMPIFIIYISQKIELDIVGQLNEISTPTCSLCQN